jgi:hypothetical protein
MVFWNRKESLLGKSGIDRSDAENGRGNVC